MVVFNNEEIEFIKSAVSFLRQGHECFRPTYRTTQIMNGILDKCNEEMEYRKENDIRIKDRRKR